LWRFGCDVLWYGGTIEEPDVDAVVVPEHGIHTSADGVEPFAIGTRVCRSDTATLITCQIGRTIGLCHQISRSTKVGSDSTSIGRMQGTLVIGVHVNSFNDVNFAVGWPIWTDCPPRRPYAASDGHVNRVHKEQPTIPIVIGLNPDAHSVPRYYGCGVYAHDGVSFRRDGRQV